MTMSIMILIVTMPEFHSHHDRAKLRSG